jgi:hypothetical protein
LFDMHQAFCVLLWLVQLQSEILAQDCFGDPNL